MSGSPAENQSTEPDASSTPGRTRREFVRATASTGITWAGALALGPRFYEQALARPARRGPSPYGPLGEPDRHGIRLPEGFTAHQIARGALPVPGTTYLWHIFSDGMATFRTPDGGWILVSNSEVPTPADMLPQLPLVGNPGEGGASAIRFDREGRIRDAYRILADTSSNCAGGPTPWGTWLSCEEHDDGLTWECDPAGEREARPLPALGTFQHEAACVDPKTGIVYLTEDKSDGLLYRFVPDPRRLGNLSRGRLQAARVHKRGRVSWHRVPDPSAASTPTRHQVPRATRFRRGEGIWFDSGSVYVATTSDSTIWRYDARRRRMSRLYDPRRIKHPTLTDVDNITVSRAGEVFVCEDDGGDDPLDIAIITPGRKPRVARFAKLTGPQHRISETLTSEVAGVCFNPRGDRMYFASQRALGVGAVYEVRGPFRRRRYDHLYGGPR